MLVCCTGGEEGEVLNPALDNPEVHTRLELRRQELAQAAEIIGYDEVVMLGYRDSGMAGSEANANPLSFAQASHDEAVGRVVEVVRRTRPQVMVIYGDDQSGYPHPDHLRVHEIGLAAFDAAADSALYPEIGPAWQVSKLYYTVFSVPGSDRCTRSSWSWGSNRPSTKGGARGGMGLLPSRSLLPSTSRILLTSGVRRFWPTPPRLIRSRLSGSGFRPR